MREEIYDISGMHCAACSSAVERVTRKLPGVEHSYVNLPMNRLTISYDESLCSPEAIIAKVERAGFGARLHNSSPEAAPAAKPESEAKSEKLCLVASMFLAGALLIVSMGQMLFPNMPMPDIISMNSHPTNFALLQLLLCIGVLFLGKRFFVSGFRSLFHLNPNMDSLVSVGVAAAMVYSLAETYLTLRGNVHAAHNLDYDGAAMILTLVTVGKALESRSRRQTGAAIRRLINLSPKTATVIRGGKEIGILTDERLKELALAVTDGGRSRFGSFGDIGYEEALAIFRAANR